MNKILIIDGNSIANRAFYALPFLSNQQGKPSGAVYGFANILIKIISEIKPTHIAVAFDHSRQTFRREIYSDYKAQRKETPKELISQFPAIKEMLSSMDIAVFEKEGIEADDIIGTLSKELEGEKILLSGDRDLLQLVSKTCFVYLTKKGVSEVDKIDLNRLYELYGLKPNQITDLKGLMGDSSDNIPGVAGVGEKTALNLLTQYQTIENIYQNIENIKGKLKEKLKQDKDNAFLSKQLATIKCDCDIEKDIDKLKIKVPFSSKVYQFFKDWDFSSLIKNESLFEKIEIEEKKNIERKTLTYEILDKIAKKQEKTFAYNLRKMEFLFNNAIYFLDENFDMFDSGITFEEVCEKLKNVFENKDILKITDSAKEDLHLLNKFNIKLNNYIDIKLANYVVNIGGNTGKGFKIEEYEQQFNKLFEKMDDGQKYVFYNIEMPLVEILFNMEKEGFKINRQKLDELDLYFSSKLMQLKEKIFQEAGEEFNINSTQQTATILFDKLGIKTYNNKKRSTSKEVLQEIEYIPIVSFILQHRKIAKLKNTYIDVYKELCKNNGDIIHTTFNQALTNTGRLSSSEPNLQNIPTKDAEGKQLRKLFVSKYENGKIISADYNQIELRLLADMSNEEKLIDAYNNNLDIHSITASEIFKVPLSEVTQEMRRDAKAINFGIIYGISDYGLSQNIKSSRLNAKQYIDSYFKRYPLVKKFMDNNIKFAKENGYAITKFGRRRWISDINSPKYALRNFAERVAMNMPLQGTASDIIKLAMIKVSEKINENNLKSKLILQIHDELIVDCYPNEEEIILQILKEEMEKITELKIPLKVSLEIGENLFECK